MATCYILKDWENLYVMLGAASATLIGFLFISVQLGIEKLQKEGVFQTRSRNSLVHLMITLVQAVAVLTPQLNGLRGSEIVLAGVIGLCMSFNFYFAVWKSTSFRAFRKIVCDLVCFWRESELEKLGEDGDFSICRARIHTSGNLLTVIGGGVLIGQPSVGMFLVTVAYVVALGLGIWNAWIQAIWLPKS